MKTVGINPVGRYILPGFLYDLLAGRQPAPRTPWQCIITGSKPGVIIHKRLNRASLYDLYRIRQIGHKLTKYNA